MQNDLPTNDLLSIGDASEYLGISIDTLRRWEKKGRIVPYRSPGGHRYFNKEDLDGLFGKRYVREEETIRTEGSYKKNETFLSTAIEEKTEDNKKQENKQELKDYLSTQESVKENFEITTKIPSQVKPVGLPSWRMIKLEKEEEFDISSHIPHLTSNNTTNDFASEHTSREVKIPEQVRIRVVRNEELTVTEKGNPEPQRDSEKILADSESKNNSKDASILTPWYSTTKLYANVTKDNNSNQSIKNNVSIFADPFYRKLILITLTILGFMFLAFGWYLLWKNSQTILSPRP